MGIPQGFKLQGTYTIQAEAIITANQLRKEGHIVTIRQEPDPEDGEIISRVFVKE